MRFDRQDVANVRDERLDAVVNAFTPSMRRVCGFFSPDELQAMIERMARNHLAARERPEHLRPPLVPGATPLGTRRAARPGSSAFPRTPRPPA